jgi:hypothetical protein
VEAEGGIEPPYTALQAAASPLCHSAKGDIDSNTFLSGEESKKPSVIRFLKISVKYEFYTQFIFKTLTPALENRLYLFEK